MKTNIGNGVKAMTALLTPIPEKQEEFLQTLLCLHAEIKKEPGCLKCVLGQDLLGGRDVLLFTVWKDLRSLHSHMNSEHFRILVGATSVLSSPADFRFVSADAAQDLSEAVATTPSPRRPRRAVAKPA